LMTYKSDFVTLRW